MRPAADDQHKVRWAHVRSGTEDAMRGTVVDRSSPARLGEHVPCVGMLPTPLLPDDGHGTTPWFGRWL